MKVSAIICSRLSSNRVKEKPFRKLNGTSIINHLLSRLEGWSPIVAVPPREVDRYRLETGLPASQIFGSDEDDPLARMFQCAKAHGIDYIIRVTHDKVFVESDMIESAMEQMINEHADYLYSSEFTPGSGFEIISFDALKRAFQAFADVEHISYAVKAVTPKEKQIHFSVPPHLQTKYRFLIDYDEDLTLMDLIFSKSGHNCNLETAIKFMDDNTWAIDINRLPKVTFYTCVYNGQEFLEQAMQSVVSQSVFADSEYLIIDDCSNDFSFYYATKFSAKHRNIHCYRNDENLGLASSSNRALKLAKGEYIIRLDADDFFISNVAAEKMIELCKQDRLDAVYPDNYFGTFSDIQKGSENHHVGGSLFATRALNHVRFTETLRGYEGLDWYVRAKDILKFGYLEEPLFFYRQHDESLTRNRLKMRAKIKAGIEKGIVGDQLVSKCQTQVP